MQLKLTKPNLELEKAHLEMLQEWQSYGEELVPFILKYDSTNFQEYIDLINGFANGIGIPESFVPHSTFWLTNSENRILGVVNIRHRLTDTLLKDGGNIGYGIRPSERRKGNATKILELALIESEKLGIERVLVTCDKKNIGSVKTILNNNGKFFKEKLIEEKLIQTFWIEN